ncbi:MAG TPA: hypothetical protein VGQ71_01165 [Terriglobales bacterium]|nr:hypothetical protein [Terriglobales bacterium]
MIPQTETILKSYFQTGDKPDQLEFEELIGTMFHQDQLAITTADDAADVAADAMALAPVCLLKATAGGGVTPPWTLAAQRNVAAMASIGSGTVRITWTTAFPNVNYVPVINASYTPSGSPPDRIESFVILSQLTNRIDVQFWMGGNVHYPDRIFLVAYQV